MATSQKIADEMNYYQYKAKQMILQKKEDQEWKDFCKKIAPDCAACEAEKSDLKETKDIGIQAPTKAFTKTEGTPVQLAHQNKQIPEALNNIKSRLEKIDLTLSRLYDGSEEAGKEKKGGFQTQTYRPVPPTNACKMALRLFEEQRKRLIQNSLKASIQKLSAPVSKKPVAIEPKNSSYFLPHDLQVKRIAARKAYLASLQTKPKVTFKKIKQSVVKKQETSKKKSVPTRKKKVTKTASEESNLHKEETLVKTFVTEDVKDENIEIIVDAILEDLMGEAALDLNKIKHLKKEKNSYTLVKKPETGETKQSAITSNLPPLSALKMNPEMTAGEESKGITMLKLFIDSARDTTQEDDKYRSKDQADKSTGTPHINGAEVADDKLVPVTSSAGASKIGAETETKTFPKFVCPYKITVDADRAKAISSRRDKYHKYLKKISRTAKRNFNPWILNEMLAESILEDCMNDVVKELNEMPSNVVQHLFHQEFVEMVES